VRGLGSDNIDHRLRHTDANALGQDKPVRWLGRSIASLSTLRTALVVGSFLRKDHPLFAARLRHAARHGAAVHSLHACNDDWLMPMGTRMVAAPSQWPRALSAIVAALVAAKAGTVGDAAVGKGGEPIVDAAAVDGNALGAGAAAAIAASLLKELGQGKAILLGQAAAHHPRASHILELAQAIAAHTGATVGYLGDGANDVGAQWVNAMPSSGGLSAQRMLSQPMKALLLLDLEPALDGSDARATRAALKASGLVVAMTPFSDIAADYADVMLPVAPFAETSGTFVNAEGRAQSFHASVKPRGDTRPAWKVLRVLGNLMGLSGFDQDSSEAVRDEAVAAAGPIAQRLSNAPQGSVAPSTSAAWASAAGAAAFGSTGAAATVAPSAHDAFERIADVPIYQTDSLVRRAPSLQATADALQPACSLPTVAWQRLGMRPGDRVVLTQGGASATVMAAHDPSLAPTAVRVAAGRLDTAELGSTFGLVGVRRAGQA
jgi:NADH-quinone oxidoreductase subunit G